LACLLDVFSETTHVHVMQSETSLHVIYVKALSKKSRVHVMHSESTDLHTPVDPRGQNLAFECLVWMRLWLALRFVRDLLDSLW
jgi:hypothetical protein